MSNVERMFRSTEATSESNPKTERTNRKEKKSKWFCLTCFFPFFFFVPRECVSFMARNNFCLIWYSYLCVDMWWCISMRFKSKQHPDTIRFTGTPCCRVAAKKVSTFAWKFVSYLRFKCHYNQSSIKFPSNYCVVAFSIDANLTCCRLNRKNLSIHR